MPGFLASKRARLNKRTINGLFTEDVIGGYYPIIPGVNIFQDIEKTTVAKKINDPIRVVSPICGTFPDMISAAVSARGTLKRKEKRFYLYLDGVDDSYTIDIPSFNVIDYCIGYRRHSMKAPVATQHILRMNIGYPFHYRYWDVGPVDKAFAGSSASNNAANVQDINVENFQLVKVVNGTDITPYISGVAGTSKTHTISAVNTGPMYISRGTIYGQSHFKGYLSDLIIISKGDTSTVNTINNFLK